jgi:hypothetical protein
VFDVRVAPKMFMKKSNVRAVFITVVKTTDFTLTELNFSSTTSHRRSEARRGGSSHFPLPILQPIVLYFTTYMIMIMRVLEFFTQHVFSYVFVARLSVVWRYFSVYYVLILNISSSVWLQRAGSDIFDQAEPVRTTLWYCTGR